MKALQNVFATFANAEKHNELFAQGEAGFTLKCNDRADIDYETRNKILNGFRMTPEESDRMDEMLNQVEGRARAELPPAPDSLDFRDFGYISEVLDQGKIKCFKSFEVNLNPGRSLLELLRVCSPRSG